MTKVKIYHNIAPNGDGFFGLNTVFGTDGKREAQTPEERHPLVKVFEYETNKPDGPGLPDARLCEEAFREFNIGTEGLAADYRARGLRSLSVGDAVVIAGLGDGRAYSCESLGFKRRELDELRIVTDVRPFGEHAALSRPWGP